MKLQFIAGILGGLLGTALHAQTPDLERIEAVTDSLARSAIADGHLPGMNVAVARNGKIIFSRAYGLANIESNTPATTETVYGLSSVTKQFTAAMVLKLVDEGRISLDDPITRHLPDFPGQGRAITVRHLLDHTSGIFSMRSSTTMDPKDFQRDITYPELAGIVKQRPAEFEPGEKRQYNNMAYYMLGALIARVSGTTYDAFVQRELAQLGITHTRLCDTKRTLPNQAASYMRKDDQYVATPYVSLHFASSMGGLCSTAKELALWSQSLHAGRVVSKASLERMTRKTVLNSGDTVPFGFGLDVDVVSGRTKYHHGGTASWGAFLSHYPDDDVSIAILTNGGRTGRIKAEEIEKILARTVLGAPLPDLPLTAREMARYEGTYTLRIGEQNRDVRIFAENGRLKGQAVGGNAGLLRYQGSHSFLLGEGGDILLTFTVPADRAESVSVLQNGRTVQGTRKP